MNIEKKIKILVLVLLSSFFLNSCLFFKDMGTQNLLSSEPVDDCSMGSARFTVNEVFLSLQNNSPIATPPKEGLKDIFTLNLKTCLIDSQLNPDTVIQSEDFQIVYTSNLTNKKEFVSVKTDAQGCIQWQESL